MRPDPHTGKRIKARRLEREMSQRALAEESRTLSYAYISRVEAGQRVPSWSALIDLARPLGTTARELGTGRRDGVCPFCRVRST